MLGALTETRFTFTVVYSFDHAGDIVELQAFPVGTTLDEVVNRLIPHEAYYDYLSVFVGDLGVPKEMWGKVKPKPFAEVYVRIVPGAPIALGLGGLLASSLATTAVASILASSTILSSAAIGIISGIVGGAVGLGFSMISQALFAPSSPTPISDQRQTREQESDTLAIDGARNRANLWGPVPFVLGTHKFTPPYAARPYTELEDNDQHLRIAVCWGHGPVLVEDVKIGNTSITEYKEVEIENDFTGLKQNMSLYPNYSYEENLRINFTGRADDEGTNTGFVRQTRGNTTEIRLSFIWPTGLSYRASTGRLHDWLVKLIIEYKLVSDVEWTEASNEFILDTTEKTKRVERTIKDLEPGGYEVRVTYRSLGHPDGHTNVVSSTYSTATLADDARNFIRDDMVWTALKSLHSDSPFSANGIAKSAYRLVATDQLSGVVNELNGIVSLLIPTWNGVTWEGHHQTSNPAAIFRYLLTADPNTDLGHPNVKRLPRDKIDNEGLGAWYDYCKAEGFRFDQVIDYRTTVRQLMTDVAAAGRASPRLVNDKWGVIIDRERDLVVAHITPRNSSNFTAQVLFPEIPHGLRVRFLNEDRDYREDERIVYDDGFNSGNATILELLELPGQVNADNVYKLGKHYLASMRLRPELFSFDLDIEALRITRGDRIRLSHDVPQIGLGFGRIKDIDPDKGIHLDDYIYMEEGKEYALRVRKSDGTDVDVPLQTTPGRRDYTTPTTTDLGYFNQETFEIAADNLYMFGEVNKQTLDCLITEIEFKDDITCTVSCIPYVPELYHVADTIPKYKSFLTPLPTGSRAGPPTPVIESLEADESTAIRRNDGSIQLSILAHFRPGDFDPANPRQRAVSSFRARFREILGEDTPWIVIQNIPDSARTVSFVPTYPGRRYEVNIQAVDEAGIPSAWDSQTILVGTQFLTPPPDIETFRLTQGDAPTAVWTYTAPPDLHHFEIRYSTELEFSVWNNMIELETNISHTVRSYALPHRTGSYAIKAVDGFGNYSVKALYLSSNIPPETHHNVVLHEPYQPLWAGEKVNTNVISQTLRLAPMGSEVMEDWTTLASVDPLAEANNALHRTGTFTSEITDIGRDVTAQVALFINISVEDLDSVMEAWTKLSDIITLAIASSGNVGTVLPELRYKREADTDWTSWGRFFRGTITARYLQVRLTLNTRASYKTPVVDRFEMSIDMPDLIKRGNDIQTSTTRYEVRFDTPYYKLESLFITGQDMQAGEIYQIYDKTENGFDIEFLTSDRQIVSRTFDYMAVGY